MSTEATLAKCNHGCPSEQAWQLLQSVNVAMLIWTQVDSSAVADLQGSCAMSVSCCRGLSSLLPLLTATRASAAINKQMLKLPNMVSSAGAHNCADRKVNSALLAA